MQFSKEERHARVKKRRVRNGEDIGRTKGTEKGKRKRKNNTAKKRESG